jgi:hypothetical protein
MTEAKDIIPKFVTAPLNEEGAPNTIKQIAAVDTYIVQYVDGGASEQVRLVFKIPGSDSVFVLAEKIQDRQIATSATGWFRDKFNKMLSAQDNHGEGSEEVASI